MSAPTPPTPNSPYVRVAEPSGRPSEREEREEQDKVTGLRPFLALGPRLFLTAFNPALLPLIFTIVHIAQTRASTADLATSIKDSVQAACGGLAKGAAALQTLPRYLAMQTNEEVLKATRATVLATGLALIYCINIITAVVNFIIDTYRSLLMCTIQLVVQGTLEILIGAVHEISDAVTNSLNSIRTGIQEDVASANSIVQKAGDAISSVLSRIGVDFSIPEISIPKLSWLQNVTIPTGFEDSLVKLNDTLPDLEELRAIMNKIVEMPFDLLINQINETRLEIAASLNDSLLPVPSLSSLSGENTKSLQAQLCTDIDMSLIDDTAKSLHNLGTVAIWAMVVVVLGAWGALAFWQWRRWRALKDTVQAVEDEMSDSRDKRRDAWAIVAVVENPVLEQYSKPVFNKLKLAPRTRNNLRWFLSYLGHPTALTLLFMSVVGFIFIEVQLAALHALQHKAQADAEQSLNASASDFAARLNSLSANASREYATDMNNVLKSLEDRINGEMFGEWINGTAVTLNNTLVTFYDEIENVLNVTFGGTILFNPINTFMYCVLGSKIDTLEKGLTWVSEHAHITLPTVSDDVLLLSPANSKELAAPLADAAVGGGSGDDHGGAVGKLVGHFEKALAAERMIYGILLGLYGFIFLAGLAVVIWHSGGKDKYDAWKAARSNSGNDGGGGDRGTGTEKDDIGAGEASRFGSTRSGARRSWTWTSPLYALYARRGRDKDLPLTPLNNEKGVQPHDISRAASSQSIRSLFATGEAFLRMGGRNERSNLPLPPLPAPSRPPRAPSPPESSTNLLGIQWQARDAGRDRHSLIVANPSSPAPSSQQSTPHLPTATFTDSPHSSPSSVSNLSPIPKTPLRHYLLPPSERRKREVEAQIDPFVDPSVAYMTVERNMVVTNSRRTSLSLDKQGDCYNNKNGPFVDHDPFDDQDIVDSFPLPADAYAYAPSGRAEVAHRDTPAEGQVHVTEARYRLPPSQY